MSKQERGKAFYIYTLTKYGRGKVDEYPSWDSLPAKSQEFWFRASYVESAR